MEAYEYNPKTYWAPYGKRRELIAAGDLGKLKIVVRDNNEKSESFSVKLVDLVFYLSVYKYLKHGDFYDGGVYQTARSALNFQHNSMKLDSLNHVSRCRVVCPT